MSTIWKNLDVSKLNYGNIAKGWYKKLILNPFNLLPQHEVLQSKIRKSFCDNCPLNSNGWCDTSKEELDINGEMVKGCGCELEAKQLSPTEHCPRLLWVEMLNKQDFEDYIITINQFYLDNNKSEEYITNDEDINLINKILEDGTTTNN